MSETHAIIRLIAHDKQTAQRLAFYLDGNTRPDFEDEVPEKERDIFKKMEFAETPIEIQWRDDVTFDAYFENIEEIDMEDLLYAVSAFELDNAYLFFADDEEYKTYKQFHNNTFKTLYMYLDDARIDETLWDLEWDERALDFVIARFAQ